MKAFFEGVTVRQAGATDHASAREILRVYDGTFDHRDNHRDNFAASHSLPSTQHRLPQTLSYYSDSISQHSIPSMALFLDLPLELVHVILQYVYLGIIDVLVYHGSLFTSVPRDLRLLTRPLGRSMAGFGTDLGANILG